MPRVSTAVKSARETKHTYICTGCRKPIEPGQRYYHWQQYRSPKRYRHMTCGRPRHSELSSAKTAPLHDSVEDALKAISNWAPTLEWDADASAWEPIDAQELADALAGVASQASEIADEYESSADNMPESLQDGSQAEAMRDVAERLREWAENLEAFDGSAEPELPDPPEGIEEDGDGWEDYLNQCQEALDSWASDQQTEAEEALSEDVPEYEG